MIRPNSLTPIGPDTNGRQVAPPGFGSVSGGPFAGKEVVLDVEQLIYEATTLLNGARPRIVPDLGLCRALSGHESSTRNVGIIWEILVTGNFAGAVRSSRTSRLIGAGPNERRWPLQLLREVHCYACNGLDSGPSLPQNPRKSCVESSRS
jgi:hypothetical protein